MQGKGSKRGFTLWVGGFVAFWAGLVLVAVFSARPAEAAAFAYVTNEGSNTVSVIDTATNKPVATVPVGMAPQEVAVTPDGKHAYVTNFSSNTVSVIDTATNKLVATVPVVGSVLPFPIGVAVTPDGTHAYVANLNSGTVSVIETAINKVVATTEPVGNNPNGICISPDGKHAYVATGGSGTVSVIDTATNKLAATVAVGDFTVGIAVTPDGKHVYVGNGDHAGIVSVIDTATNKVVATVTVGNAPVGIAITPDGKDAYVANDGSGTLVSAVSVIDTDTNKVAATVALPKGGFPVSVAVRPDGKFAYVANASSNTVSVIATAINKVVATVPVGMKSIGVGIIPDIPFSAFSANLQIDLGRNPNEDAFFLESSFTLGSASTGIHSVTEPVTLQIGTFATTIPPGSFKGKGFGPFTFQGVIDGAALEVTIEPTGTKRFALEAAALDANLGGTKNPVTVRVSIGNNSATASVKADTD